MAKMEKEMIEQNIELSAEFSRYLFDHPDLDKTIAPDAEIILLPEFNAEVKDFNLKLGRKLEANGNKVVYIKIESIRPKIVSRIEGVSLHPSA
jgi:hypothetical protein